MKTVIDLFSGIGGFALGLHRAGFQTVQFCEVNPFCQKVLQKNFPGIPIHDDIRTLRWSGPRPFLVCGGFPCQDISVAGTGSGLAGKRSGLWSEMLRVVREAKPSWVITENVPALRTRGADQVLSDLEEADYTAEPLVVGAWAVGAIHKRQRVWVVAHANGIRLQERSPHRLNGVPVGQAWSAAKGKQGWERMECWLKQTVRAGDWSEPPSPVLGVDDGVPARVDRITALGNSVVPQIPELLGRWILSVSP